MAFKILIVLVAIMVMLFTPSSYSLSKNSAVIKKDISLVENTFVFWSGIKQINPMVMEEAGDQAQPEEKTELRKPLERVCSCESSGDPDSGWKQHDKDGNVIRGVINNLDVGSCQINLYYWGDEAESLGFDLNSEEGNIKMANYIYDNYGLTPWNASRHCWE